MRVILLLLLLLALPAAAEVPPDMIGTCNDGSACYYWEDCDPANGDFCRPKNKPPWPGAALHKPDFNRTTDFDAGFTVMRATAEWRNCAVSGSASAPAWQEEYIFDSCIGNKLEQGIQYGLHVMPKIYMNKRISRHFSARRFCINLTPSGSPFACGSNSTCVNNNAGSTCLPAGPVTMIRSEGAQTQPLHQDPDYWDYKHSARGPTPTNPPSPGGAMYKMVEAWGAYLKDQWGPRIAVGHCSLLPSKACNTQVYGGGVACGAGEGTCVKEKSNLDFLVAVQATHGDSGDAGLPYGDLEGRCINGGTTNDACGTGDNTCCTKDSQCSVGTGTTKVCDHSVYTWQGTGGISQNDTFQNGPGTLAECTFDGDLNNYPFTTNECSRVTGGGANTPQWWTDRIREVYALYKAVMPESLPIIISPFDDSADSVVQAAPYNNNFPAAFFDNAWGDETQCAMIKGNAANQFYSTPEYGYKPWRDIYQDFYNFRTVTGKGATEYDLRSRAEFATATVGNSTEWFLQAPVSQAYWQYLEKLHYGTDAIELGSSNANYLFSGWSRSAFLAWELPGFFSKYSGFKAPQDSLGAFVAFRDGLDNSDFDRFPCTAGSVSQAGTINCELAAYSGQQQPGAVIQRSEKICAAIGRGCYVEPTHPDALGNGISGTNKKFYAGVTAGNQYYLLGGGSNMRASSVTCDLQSGSPTFNKCTIGRDSITGVGGAGTNLGNSQGKCTSHNNCLVYPGINDVYHGAAYIYYGGSRGYEKGNTYGNGNFYRFMTQINEADTWGWFRVGWDMTNTDRASTWPLDRCDEGANNYDNCRAYGRYARSFGDEPDMTFDVNDAFWYTNNSGVGEDPNYRVWVRVSYFDEAGYQWALRYDGDSNASTQAEKAGTFSRCISGCDVVASGGLVTNGISNKWKTIVWEIDDAKMTNRGPDAADLWLVRNSVNDKNAKFHMVELTRKTGNRNDYFGACSSTAATVDPNCPSGNCLWVSPASNNSACTSAGVPWACCSSTPGQGCIGGGVTCSESLPCDTLKKATDIATSGTVINVLPGTYSSTYENHQNPCPDTVNHKYGIRLDNQPGLTIQKAPSSPTTPLFTQHSRAIGIKNSPNTTISGLSFNTTGSGRGFCILDSNTVNLTDVQIAIGRWTQWPTGVGELNRIDNSDDVTLLRHESYMGEPTDTVAQRMGLRQWTSHYWIKFRGGSDRFTLKDSFIHDFNQLTASEKSTQEDHTYDGNLFLNFMEHGITAGNGTSGVWITNNVFAGRVAGRSCFMGNCTCGDCTWTGGSCWDQCKRGWRALDFWECPMSPVSRRRCKAINNTLIGQNGGLIGGASRNYAYPARVCANCGDANLTDCTTPEKKCNNDILTANNLFYEANSTLQSGIDYNVVIQNQPATMNGERLDYAYNWYAHPVPTDVGWKCHTTAGGSVDYKASDTRMGGCSGNAAACTSDLDCSEIGQGTCTNPTPLGFHAWQGDANCFYPDSARGGGASQIDNNPNQAKYFVDYTTGDSTAPVSGMDAKAQILANYAIGAPDAPFANFGEAETWPGGCSTDRASCLEDTDCAGETNLCNNPLPTATCMTTDINGTARGGKCTPGAFAGPADGSFCGDGIVDPGEDCDDGNQTPGDGCENDCTFTVAVCGDGLITPGQEDCDPGADVAGDCCSASCQFVAASTACDDGLFCWEGSVCDGATATCPQGTTPKNCDEPNVCTDDTCDDEADVCLHTTCTDNDPSCSATAISWDATTASGALTPGTTINQSHTAGALTNGLGVVYFYGIRTIGQPITDCVPTSVTYDGNTMSLGHSGTTEHVVFQVWMGGYFVPLGTASGGSKTVTANFSNSSCEFASMTVTTLSGVDQTAPLRTSGSNISPTNIATSILNLTTVSGDFIVDSIYHRGDTDSGTAVICDQIRRAMTTGTGRMYVSTLEADTTSETLQWNLSPERSRVVHIGMTFKEAPSTPAPPQEQGIAGGAGTIQQ